MRLSIKEACSAIDALLGFLEASEGLPSLSSFERTIVPIATEARTPITTAGASLDARLQAFFARTGVWDCVAILTKSRFC